MSLGSLYNRIASISPFFEITLRNIYWRNVGKLKRYNPNKASGKKNEKQHVDFEKVESWLKSQGVGKGSLLIVHSSYEGLECTGLTPEQIVERLLALVGPTGTLCMPVIRRFKEEVKARKEGLPLTEIECKYDVKRTLVSSGMMPFVLMRNKEARVSHFPLNPLCAVGPLAMPMMEHNLEGDFPSPHGPNSAWKFCVDHHAMICSLGTNLEHHNTTIHVAEEAYGDWPWTDEQWYDHRKFEIIDENKQSQKVVVKNRKEKWGKRHLAGINMNNAEKKAGILKSEKRDGVIQVGFAEASKVIAFLRERNANGYPYYLFPWQKKK